MLPRPLLPLALVALAATVVGLEAHAHATATTSTQPPARTRAAVAAPHGPVPPKRPFRPRARPKKPVRRAPRLAAGSRGTLAWAIANHTPKVHVPIADGLLPAVVANASCPDDMASVDDRFCVDRFEASLVEVLADGSTAAWSPSAAPDAARTYRAVSLEGVVPQAYISGATAAAACQAAGKRLCQPVEWRSACGGSAKSTYPYGPSHVAGKCNDHGKSPMLVYYPQVEKGWNLVGAAEMNDPRLDQLPGTLTKTGELEGCVNDYGVHDMVGNLHEWTADPNGTFQGGYYLDTSQNGEGCSYRTAAHDFAYHDYSTGFRCCADATQSAGD